MKLDDVPMVCISLERRPERWDAFHQRAAGAGLRVSKLPAVDAKGFQIKPHEHPDISLLTAHNIYYGIRRSHYEIDAAGAIGCSLSHFEAWRRLLSSSAPAMIIFEDDSPIPADLKARLTALMGLLPAEWDVIQFQRTEFANGSACKPIPGEEPWHLCTGLMGSYAYMVSRRGAQRLLARAYPIELHMDAYMAFLSRVGEIRMLWHPSINIPQPDGDSDIAHGAQGILSVPTQMELDGYIAMETKTMLGILALAATVGAMLSLAYVPRTR
jgi:GR25 family glycosyltransferase involved in LPS biosynthesis